jgi:chitodextrinase
VGTGNTSTGYSDYASLGQYFINGSMAVSGSDTTPPNPNPMGWIVPPEATGQTSISMTATVATDETSSVQYEFRCVAGSGSGCASSGWKTSNSHTASGLTAGASYTFNVIARDQANNTTATSPSMSATTQSAPDTTPPNPNPMSWASVPAATGQNSIAMTATVATDAVSSVKYKFRCLSGGNGCVDSGWISTTSYTASGLAAGTAYSFEVLAQDVAGNTTGASPAGSATTAAPPIPPSSNITLNLSTSSNDSRVSVKWSGANGKKSDIYRNGSKIKTTVNHGDWDDRKVLKGNTYRYRVCEQGSTTACSGETSIAL